jgi:hypothetical protein
MYATVIVAASSGRQPAKQLMDALPKLRLRFERKSKSLAMPHVTGASTAGTSTEALPVFPLFSAKAEESVWKTVPLNPDRQAAILVPLVEIHNEPSLLFTARSSALPTHASEVSFPGGHFDADVDTTLEDTALREAQEELLGDYDWKNGVEILGRASSLPSISGTPVTPILAVITQSIAADTFPGHKGEVEEVFCVSIKKLLEVETSEDSPRFRSRIPVYPIGETRIWGLTAVVTRPILHQLLKPIFCS